MVRPVARYRPAARRGPQLEPVFTIAKRADISSIPLAYNSIDGFVQVYTGSNGKIAEFDLWDLNARDDASNADPGFVSAATVHFNNVYSGIPGAPQILNAEWDGIYRRQFFSMFEHVIGSSLYACYLRSSTFTASYILHLTNGSIGDSPIASSALYDLITVTVSLESGQVTSSQSPFYSSTLSNITQFSLRSDDNQYILTRSGSYSGYAEGIVASLPDSHPFKVCGNAPWGFLQELSDGAPGDYSQTYTRSLTVPVFTFLDFVTATNGVPAPHSFHTHVRGGLRLDNIAGISSQITQRIIRSGSVHELSELGEAWPSCTGYSLLGASVPTTFVEYTQSNVEDLASLLDVSALSQDDQAQLTASADAPNPPIPLPSFVNAQEYETSNPVYFVTSGYRPSFAQPNATDLLRAHYLIPD